MEPIWVAWALAAAIVFGYAVALWWWAAREAGPWVRAALLGLCAAALALRVAYFTEFPAGLNEDEPKNLACSMQALARWDFLKMACNGVPFLLSMLFAVPLVPVLGFTRWAIRFYSLALSVLSPAAAYAVGRGMRFDATASLVFAGLIAVLPWSLFYGRVSLGGELVFHQLLVLAAVARLVWRETSGWREALLGGVALCLLLYGYYAGRAVVALPLIGAVLAPTLRTRAWCLALLAAAVAGWLPYWWAGSQHDSAIAGALLNWRSPDPAMPIIHRGFAAAPLETLWERLQLAVRVLFQPVAQLSIWTIPSGALHPPVVLGAAAAGLLLTSFRRKLFLLGGFVAGALPAVLSDQTSLSTHRMLTAFPFVALAASAAVAALPWPRWRRGVAVVLLGLAAAGSIRLYFSPRYWTAEAARAFDRERTAAVEYLRRRPAPRVILGPHWGEFPYIVPPHTRQEALTVENWWPPAPATYAFDPTAVLLAPVYDRVFPGAVRRFGDAFVVSAGDPPAERPAAAYGWRHAIACDGAVAYDGTVPALLPHVVPLPAAQPACAAPRFVTAIWAAHWDGPDAAMQLEFSGNATVVIDGERLVHAAGFEQRAAVAVPHGSTVAITITVTPDVRRAALLDVSDGAPRLPRVDHLRPARMKDVP